MSQIIGSLIAFAAAGAFVWAIWSISQALMRRGIVVRPVSMMDARMAEIERRHATTVGQTDTTAPDQVNFPSTGGPCPQHNPRR